MSLPISAEQFEILLPLACRWPAEQEQHILGAGEPLSLYSVWTRSSSESQNLSGFGFSMSSKFRFRNIPYFDRRPRRRS